jgi:hypothetical protein
MTKKKYTLKPGRHQFAPKSPPVHDNDHLSDEEAEWYLERYPHIAQLFVEKLEGCADSHSEVEKLSATPSGDSDDKIIQNL